MGNLLTHVSKQVTLTFLKRGVKMFCPKCGKSEDVMQDSLDTFCNSCDTRFIVLPKMETVKIENYEQNIEEFSRLMRSAT